MSVGRNCKFVYMSRRSWFYVCMFFYIYTVKCMYICLNVFMYLCIYMFAIRWERERKIERGREIERGGDKSLEGNLIALKNVVICLHDPIKLYLANRFWPSALINSVLLSIGKQNVMTENDNNFLCFEHAFFWNLNFLHLFSYHIKNYHDFLRKKKSCSLSFNPRQENHKMFQYRTQKQLFDVLSMLYWKLKFLHLSSYHNKNY